MGDPRLLSVAQLMVVLDATIVTVALPSAQRALHFSNDSRQWLVTAYALAFGSLLSVGGKVGDLFGRADRHEHLGGPGLGTRHVAHVQHLDATVIVDSDCLHEPVTLTPTRR